MASAAAATPHRLNQAGLARSLGVSRQAVSDLIKRQVIPIGGDGLIDVEVARMAIASRVRPSAKTNAAAASAAPPSPQVAQDGAPDAQLSYHVAKTLREAAEAKIAQLRLAEMRGDLVRADKVRSATSRLAAGLRESLQQLPDRLAAILAVETSQARVRDILATEIDRALTMATQEGST